MFGDKFNLGSLMKNAKKMQQLMEEKQAALEKIEVQGESGTGAVRVTMTAKHYIKKLDISDDILKEPKEIREELIVAAINNAVKKVEELTKSMMADVTTLLGSTSKEDE